MKCEEGAAFLTNNISIMPVMLFGKTWEKNYKSRSTRMNVRKIFFFSFVIKDAFMLQLILRVPCPGFS